MSTIAIIATAGALIWGISLVVVLLLGIGAHRNHPAVVVDDPWERPEIREAWDRVRFDALDREVRRSARRVLPPPPSSAA